MGSVHLDHLSPVRFSLTPLTVWPFFTTPVRDMLLLKPSPERLVAYLDPVSRQKLLTGMRGTEFLVPVPAERYGFGLYLVRNPIMGSLPSRLVANASVTLCPDAPDEPPYLSFH